MLVTPQRREERRGNLVLIQSGDGDWIKNPSSKNHIPLNMLFSRRDESFWFAVVSPQIKKPFSPRSPRLCGEYMLTLSQTIFRSLNWYK